MNRILLIEDDPGTQILFRNRLEDLGYAVVHASTGAKGLLESRAGHFDLFLVDIGLGSGIDGYEVCRRLKATPQLHSVPVVLISGQVRSQEELHKGYEAGCEAYLLKGDLTLLEDVVRAMLRIKSLQDDLALQNRLLEEHNRKLNESRQRGAELESALRETGARAPLFRELAAGRPDGVLLVDHDGVVRYADRCARDVMGGAIEGHHLAAVAPESGLEAFVRDARTDAREAYRFDLPRGAGIPARTLSASVVPMVPSTSGGDPGWRVVLILDASKRRVAAEILRLEEQGVPRRELGPLIEAARRVFHSSEIRGECEPMRRLRREVSRLANENDPVLVLGARGTGKELVARSLHFSGNRSGPFVPVDCPALAPEQMPSEIFGHVKGARPEAAADRSGLLQHAQHGTLFLEEISALTAEVQAGIERLLREGTLQRVGDHVVENASVRIVASSRHDLDKLVSAGRFSADLAKALRVRLTLPPLVERGDDAGLLALHFFQRFGPSRGRHSFSDEAMLALVHYDWPGNVSELERVVEVACASASGDSIELEELPPAIVDSYRLRLEARMTPSPLPTRRMEQRRSVLAALGQQGIETPAPEEPLSLENYEKMAVVRALQEARGNKLTAAKLLGLGKSTFYRKLKTHGIA